MNRAIRRFVGSLNGPKKYLFFLGLALICVVCLCLGIYAQFFYKYSDTDMFMIGINIGSQKTAEEIAILKANFNSLFDDSIKINSENVRTEKMEPSRELVYTGYTLENEDENYYSVSANIPILNINTDAAKKINADIKTEFYDKANLIMRRSEGYTIYSTNYASFVNEDVLSIVIKSSLKEQNKAEKVTVRTYTYSISEQREVSLQELIKLKEVEETDIQKIIRDDIQTAYTNAKLIASEYGSLYERDVDGVLYKIENSDTYFLTQDGYVYVVYAYGNNDYTNEMDIVIF